MFAFVVRVFYESLKFRPTGKKCQVELVGYAYEGLYGHGSPQRGSVRLQLRYAFVFRFNQKLTRLLCPIMKTGGIKEVKAQIVVYFIKKRTSLNISALQDILGLPVPNDVICNYDKLGMISMNL